MNNLLTNHFTEDEFIELRDGKTIITQSYLDGGSYTKNRIVKSLGTKKIYQSTQYLPKLKKYPGGPLIEQNPDINNNTVEDTITLYHINLRDTKEHLWIIDHKINKSGWCGTHGISEFRNINGWPVLNHLGEVETYIGVGDKFGELKPFSKSIENSKYIGKVEVGDTFIHINNSHCLYVTKDNGITMTCEKWGFNKGRSGINSIFYTGEGPVNYYGDIRMTEDDILNMYHFLKKSKIGSDNLEDYFGYHGVK